ncbi:hypothetical protein [Symbiopectobacterium sp. RP]|uniref:hypothetical protein n=1 Tax=Symbiopectobacterium sp. RP TaxID=3248553 RepID=UPI003D2A636C
MITSNALICGKKIQLIVIKIMSLSYTDSLSACFPSLSPLPRHRLPGFTPVRK